MSKLSILADTIRRIFEEYTQKSLPPNSLKTVGDAILTPAESGMIARILINAFKDEPELTLVDLVAIQNGIFEEIEKEGISIRYSIAIDGPYFKFQWKNDFT